MYGLPKYGFCTATFQGRNFHLLRVSMSPDLIELFCCHFHRRSMTGGADEFSQVRVPGCEWTLREVAAGGQTGEVMIPGRKTSGRAQFG
jgi:hypothetical protein